MTDRTDPVSPDPATRALLRACLFPEESEASWREYQRLRAGRARTGEVNLLALAYRNLRDVDPYTCPGLVEARTTYLTVRGRNQILLAAIEPVLRVFASEGIPFVVLKGGALAIHWYRDTALRSMLDWDLLVPEARREEAWACLARLGWTPALPPPPEELRRFFHAHPFVHDTAGAVDLHVHSLWNDCAPGSDEGFWARSRPLDIRGVPARRLSAADQLLHVCVHGLRFEVGPSYRWIADAVAVIGGDEAVDWDVLVSESCRRRVVPAARVALAALREDWGAAVPEAALEALRRERPGRAQVVAFEARLHPDFSEEVRPSIVPRWHQRWPERLSDYLAFLAFDLWRCVGSRPSLRDVRDYTSLLAWRWGFRSRGRVLLYLASLVARRGARALVRRVPRVGRRT